MALSDSGERAAAKALANVAGLGEHVAEVVEVRDMVGSGVAEAVASAAAARERGARSQAQRGRVRFDVLRFANEREAAVIVVGARGLTRINTPVDACRTRS